MFKVPGNLVPIKMPDHEAPGASHDHGHLVGRPDHHHSVGPVLRSGGRLQGDTRSGDLLGGLATRHGRQPVLLAGQFAALLHHPHHPHLDLLHSDLDTRGAPQHPDRHQGWPGGAHAAEVQIQGGQDAGGSRGAVCALLDAALRHFCQDQVWRRNHWQGGGGKWSSHKKNNLFILFGFI